MVDHRFQITQNYKLCLRPIPVRFFFFSTRFELFSQSWTLYASKSAESAGPLRGMSSSTLQDVLNAKIRLSTGAVTSLTTSQNLIKKYLK